MSSEEATSAPRRHIVASVGELEPGRRKIVKVAGREIGIFNLDGHYYGLRNLCPHKSGPLCLGRLRPFVQADGFDIYYERENEILKCPWHQWEFEVKTGCSVVDPNIRVRSYRVEQEGEDIVLYL